MNGSVLKSHIVRESDVTIHAKKWEGGDEGLLNIIGLDGFRFITLMNSFDVKSTFNFSNKIIKRGARIVLRSDLELTQIFILKPWIIDLISKEEFEWIKDISLDLIPFLVKNQAKKKLM